MTFEDWMKKVDAIFIRKTGLDRDSWPDWCYYDAFEDGCTPEDAFEDAWEEISDDSW